MTCKVDHGPEGMPKFLCRVCNPELNRIKPAVAAEEVSDRDEAGIAKFKKRQVRKLRVEEKRLRELADDIGHRDPAALRKVYEALKVVEKEIDRVNA